MHPLRAWDSQTRAPEPVGKRALDAPCTLGTPRPCGEPQASWEREPGLGGLGQTPADGVYRALDQTLHLAVEGTKGKHFTAGQLLCKTGCLLPWRGGLSLNSWGSVRRKLLSAWGLPKPSSWGSL